MPQISTNEFKSGVKVEMEGSPYVIIANEYVKPGKGQAFNRVKLKHLLNGRTLERTFKSGDKLDVADIVETEMRMLYKEGADAYFMDEKTFEQISVPLANIGDTAQWLLDDLMYGVLFYNGEAVTISPPTFLDLRVTETAPGDKGNTASGRVLKPAILETGAQVQVPLFVGEGEKVKIDTRTGEYVSRVSE